MPDTTAMNEVLRQVADAYRVFSLELRAIQVKKADLVKSILERVEREKTADVHQIIKEMIYDRKAKN